MARSFGLRVFEAESIDELTAEQYEVLSHVFLDTVREKMKDATSRTVSIRTKP